MTARALVWKGGSDFQSVDVPLPTPGPGETLVRLTAATVCGSDRHTVSGRRSAPCPSVLGHEGVGTVVATVDGRLADGTAVTPGQRVVFGVTRTCGTCPLCLRGLTAKCTSVEKAGHESFLGEWPLSGTYASHILLRPGQAVVPVPESLSDGAAATAGCAVATVMAMLDRAGELPGRRVLVHGLGMLGIVAVAAARHRGAQVLASDRNPSRLELARSLGAAPVDGGSPALSSVDVALELSGAPAGVSACIASLDIGGTAVLAGSVAPSAPVDLDPEWIVRGWRTVTGVHNYEPRHLQQAVLLLEELGDALPWDQILDGPVTAEQLSQEFERPTGSGLRTVLTL